MPIGIFLFALKYEFQKSEENGEKRRKPEKISGFLIGIFLSRRAGGDVRTGRIVAPYRLRLLGSVYSLLCGEKRCKNGT